MYSVHVVATRKKTFDGPVPAGGLAAAVAIRMSPYDLDVRVLRQVHAGSRVLELALLAHEAKA